MAFTCFVSYARPDRQDDPYLLKFVEQLRTDLSVKLRLSRTDALFFDTESLELGSEWNSRIRTALGTSKVLVSLCSPNYLGCEFCGREYQVFLQRREQSIAERADGEYDVIIPLLWIPPDVPLPRSIAQFQHSHGDMPDVYAVDGLRHMMKLKKYEDDYFEFIKVLVNRIEVAAKRNLKALDAVPPMDEINNAFSDGKGGSAAKVEAPARQPLQRGPKNSHVAYFAANKAEITSIRKTSEIYGDIGWDWSPYHEKIGSIVQQVTGRGVFRYIEMNVSDDFDKRLEEAAANNEIVILIVDAWSTYIDRYKDALRPYDQRFLINVSVLVPWNPEDAETVAHRDQLIASLEELFPRKMLQPPVNHYWESISSEDELRRTLEHVLNVTQMNILRLGTVWRTAKSEALTEQARQTGIVLNVKPTLIGSSPIGTP
jgi:FxsC-like protein